MDVTPMPPLAAGEAFGRPVVGIPHLGPPRARRRSWRTLGLLAAVLICTLPVALVAALVVASVISDAPIDFPPGDVYSLTVENDTSRPVDAFMCDDPTCVRGVWPETIQPGHHNASSLNEDQYTPSTVGLADPFSHALLGCLTPPSTHSASESLKTTSVGVSSIHACAKHSDAAHLVVTFYDPLAN